MCGSPRTNKSTCPLNPSVLNPNHETHPYASSASGTSSKPRATSARSMLPQQMMENIAQFLSYDDLSNISRLRPNEATGAKQTKQVTEFERLINAANREKRKYATILSEYLILENGGNTLIARLQQTSTGPEAAIGSLIMEQHNDEDDADEVEVENGNLNYLRLNGQKGLKLKPGDIITHGSVNPVGGRQNYKIKIVQPYVRVTIPDGSHFSPHIVYNPHVNVYYGNSLLFELKDGYYMYVGGGSTYKFLPTSPIVSYYSPIGNAGVPYPYAFDSDRNCYLMNKRIKYAYPWMEEVNYDLDHEPYNYYYTMRDQNPGLFVEFIFTEL